MTLKYNEIMEKVEVTDEMRERILTNIREKNTEKKKKVIVFNDWRKLGTLAACAVILLLCITVLPGIINREVPENEDYSVSVVNGIIDCKDAEELSQKAGFRIVDLSEIPFEVTEKYYSWWFETTAQIDYYGNNNSISYRVAEGSGDISGDYNNYEWVREERILNTKVTIKGNGELAYLAVWSFDKYSYSVSAAEGISCAEMISIIEASDIE